MYFLRLEHATAVLAYLLFVVFFFVQPKLQGQGDRNDFFGNAFQSKQTIPKGILVNDDRCYHGYCTW